MTVFGVIEVHSITEAADLIATRNLSPVELAQQCLSSIENLDQDIHSFISVTAERALDDARAAERRVMTGSLKGRLDGIPIAHKDIFCTRGIPTTAHSRMLRDWVPTEDAHVVTLLARAGTSMLGKTATHEFALGGPSFDLPWPPARNPWNTDYFTSGSSSGAAAAIASGFVLGASGSDTGGSIREPAALCGVVGVKPTYGLCSQRGILPLAKSLDHPGPIARTVEDCALLLQAMAGYDDADSTSVDLPLTDITADLKRSVKGLRIGIVPSWMDDDCPVTEAVQSGFQRALAVWREQGAEIVELRMPSLFDYQAATVAIMLREAYLNHKAALQTCFAEYGELLRDRLLVGGLLSEADYVQALNCRRPLCRATAVAAAGVDVIATPAASSEAPRIEQVTKWGFLKSPGFAKPFNLTGWPALSMCAGFSASGLPVGLQVAAKPFQERMLFRVANSFERASEMPRTLPALTVKPGGFGDAELVGPELSSPKNGPIDVTRCGR